MTWKPPDRSALVGAALCAAVGPWLAGCRCAPEPAALEEPHYAGWDALVDAAWRGDRERTALLARDLRGGPVTEAPEGAAGLVTVSGALGFLPFAEDRHELIQGITVAARGCAECHRAQGVPEPAPRVCDHAAAALCVADAVVWDRALGSFAGDVPPEIGGAWGRPVSSEPPQTEAETRAAAALEACAACHEKPP